MSPDGHFVAFLSDKDGQMDVWVTQVGSGQFHNLTRGGAGGLVNPSIRTPGFSPDGALVTYWVRREEASGGEGAGEKDNIGVMKDNSGGEKDNISVWAVPTLGGRAAAVPGRRSGVRLVAGRIATGVPHARTGRPDVCDGRERSIGGQPDFLPPAPAGLHSLTFRYGSPDAAFIYFVQGSLPDKLDILRIPSGGGAPERITSHNAVVSHPVLLDRRTLMYLASDADGSGPWLYSMDVERRIPHRLTSGPDRYTSLAASADGRRMVATLATPKRTLSAGCWVGDAPADVPASAVPDSADDKHGVLATTGAGLSAVCLCDGDERKYMEARQWDDDGAVEW